MKLRIARNECQIKDDKTISNFFAISSKLFFPIVFFRQVQNKPIKLFVQWVKTLEKFECIVAFCMHIPDYHLACVNIYTPIG